VALLGGFFLNYLGQREPPVVTVYTDEVPTERKPEVKDLNFFEGEKKEEKEIIEDGESELVIVAFRLPVKVTRTEDGWNVEWQDIFARNVFADLKVLNKRNLVVKWVGTVPGAEYPPTMNERLELEEELEQFSCYPVFLNPEIRRKFYREFCKGTLWPLFHYVMPQAVKLDTDFGTRWDSVWQAYRAGNMFFAKCVNRVMENSDDFIWVHGYHLLLVPSLVRRNLSKARIGLFVHEPWPSSEVFRSLPARENILRGMLACDLIGFQTYDYVRHFLSCCKRLLNLDFKSLAGGSIGVMYAGRSVAIRISHVGSRSEFFQKLSESKKVKQEIKTIRSVHQGKTMILTVDYMDLTKGPQMKLQAFYRFLRGNPEKAKTLSMVQVVLPSSNADKNEVKKIVMHEVKRIRSEFGEKIIHIVDNPELEKLVAYYMTSQVAIISTFWDGLNLIPYEYTASQNKESPGALVISEFMGCSRSLSGVIRVNPWSIEGTANAFLSAINMSLAKRKALFNRRYKYVMDHTLEEWAWGFLKDLRRASEYNSNLKFVQVGFSSDVRLVGLRSDFAPVDLERITPVFQSCSSRLILLDYDGTLIGESKSGSMPPAGLKQTLRDLCSDEKNIVFIMSGRRRKDLIKFFGDIDRLGLAAEKGCFVRWPKHILKYIHGIPESTLPSLERRTSVSLSLKRQASPWISIEDKKNTKRSDTTKWYSLCDPSEMQWKSLAMEVIKAYDARTDGAIIEPKEYGIVWKFEGADPDYGQMQAGELQKYLKELISDGAIDVVVYDDNRILEILPKGVNKGVATTLLINTLRGAMKGKIFLMAVGDDVSDEKMFSALQNNPILGHDDSKNKSAITACEVVTCCVGLKPSSAQYYAHDPEEVIGVLKALSVSSRVYNYSEY